MPSLSDRFRRFLPNNSPAQEPEYTAAQLAAHQRELLIREAIRLRETWQQNLLQAPSLALRETVDMEFSSSLRSLQDAADRLFESYPRQSRIEFKTDDFKAIVHASSAMEQTQDWPLIQGGYRAHVLLDNYGKSVSTIRELDTAAGTEYKVSNDIERTTYATFAQAAAHARHLAWLSHVPDPDWRENEQNASEFREQLAVEQRIDARINAALLPSLVEQTHYRAIEQLQANPPGLVANLSSRIRFHAEAESPEQAHEKALADITQGSTPGSFSAEKLALVRNVTNDINRLLQTPDGPSHPHQSDLDTREAVGMLADFRSALLSGKTEIDLTFDFTTPQHDIGEELPESSYDYAISFVKPYIAQAKQQGLDTHFSSQTSWDFGGQPERNIGPSQAISDQFIERYVADLTAETPNHSQHLARGIE